MGVKPPKEVEGDPSLALEPLRLRGLEGGEPDCGGVVEEPKTLLVTGVMMPGVSMLPLRLGPAGPRRSASDAALSRRLVVPRALVEPERAEHTTATLLSST